MNNEIVLCEKIIVVAVFGGGISPCRPTRFRRVNGQEITISEIGLWHPARRGQKVVHIFEVTDGLSDYRLEFDGDRLGWRLTREATRG